MGNPSRTRLVALVVLVAISAVLVAIALSAQGDDAGSRTGVSRPAGLRLEASVQDLPAELTIYLENREANTPETTHGKRRVTVECVNGGQDVVFQTGQPWPFTGTDGGVTPPHVHIQMDPAVLDRIVRCRLKDTDPALEGRKP